MQRYPLKFRLSAYNEGSFYQLIPAGRRAVAPGERISKIVADVRFCSSMYTGANLTPMLCQAWAFYVPHRLVWDQWIDFIAMDDTVTAPPTATTAFPQLFEGNAGGKVSFPRRAYKLIYNQYFGDESQAADAAWFPDVTDDTNVNLGRLLIWDQFRSHARSHTYTQQTYVAAVSGATATIQLDDLQRSIRTNNARRRQKLTGDKYVDTMRLMGVELDWRVQMAPEFLGASQQVIMGKVQQSAAGTDLTTRVTAWEGVHQLVVKRRLAFAEHGTLLLLVGFRPLVALSVANAYDAFQTSLDTFYRPDTHGGPTNSGTQMVERNGLYLKGRNVIGKNMNAQVFVDNSASTTALYPDPSQWTPVTGAPPSAMAFFTDFSIAGLTPVPPQRG